MGTIVRMHATHRIVALLCEAKTSVGYALEEWNTNIKQPDSETTAKAAEEAYASAITAIRRLKDVLLPVLP